MSDKGQTVVVTLADERDVFSFVVGQPLVWSRVGIRRETWRDRLRRRLRRLLWWRQERYETTAIDAEAGTVTMAPLRWSWRHWRWERGA